MKLRTNAIDVESVDRVQEGGQEWLVAPVVLVRAQDLNGGYLPTTAIANSADEWDGVPVPIGHPTADGEPISIQDERADVPIVGQIRDPEAQEDGQQLAGELWVNVSDAQSAGSEGKRLVRRLENGDAVEVSTGYFPGQVVSGNFDGQERERAVLDITPDHLAALVDDVGKCSISDGCGAGAPRAPAVNRLFVPARADDPNEGEDSGQVTMLTNIRDRAREPTFRGTETTSWADVDKTFSAFAEAVDTDAEQVEDLSDAERQAIAEHSLLGESDAETFDDLVFFPVVNPETGELNEGALDAVISGRGESADIPQDALESAQTVARNLLEEEFDRDLENNARTLIQRALSLLGRDPTDEPEQQANDAGGNSGVDNSSESKTNTMGDKTQELVENHGFSAENLPDEDCECFGRIYDLATNEDGEAGNEAGDDSTQTETEQADDQTGGIDVNDLVDELEDRFVTTDELGETIDEALAANREQERKEGIAEDIVANSDYDEIDAVLEDYPTEAALETKRDDVAESDSVANYSIQRTDSPSANTDDVSDFPALSVSEREQELNGGGD